MLPKTDIPFNTQYQQTALGPMIILKSPYGISSPEAISYQNQSFLATTIPILMVIVIK